MRIASRAVLAITAASTLVIPAVAAAGPASATVRRAAIPAASGYSVPGSLAGVAATSTRSAWAVGFAGKATSAKVLMLRWNGTKWNRFTSPKVLTESGELSAITVVNANDAWAVGSSGSFEHPRTLILHWNGKTWSEVTSPKPVGGGSLTAVTANAAGGWAVGSLTTGPTVPQTMPLILKLTGTKWSRSSPKFGAHSGVFLNGVASTPTTTFATGLYTGMITGVLARLSGQSWNFVSFPQQGTFHWLNAIAAGPHGIAFAVGFKTSAGLGVVSIEWNGHAWVKAPAPNSANLNTVAFAPGGAGTAWAGGYRDSGSSLHPLILRWNGHAWSSVTSPGGSGQLTGLGFASGNYGWAVGNSNPDSSQSKTLIEHWNGHSWH